MKNITTQWGISLTVSPFNVTASRYGSGFMPCQMLIVLLYITFDAEHEQCISRRRYDKCAALYKYFLADISMQPCIINDSSHLLQRISPEHSKCHFVSSQLTRKWKRAAPSYASSVSYVIIKRHVIAIHASISCEINDNSWPPIL